MEGQAGAAQSTVAKPEPRGRGSQRAGITEQTAPNSEAGLRRTRRGPVRGAKLRQLSASRQWVLGARCQTVSGGLATLPSETGCRGCITEGNRFRTFRKAQGARSCGDPRGGVVSAGPRVGSARLRGRGAERQGPHPWAGAALSAGPGEGSQSRGPGASALRSPAPRLRGPRTSAEGCGIRPTETGARGELGTRRGEPGANDTAGEKEGCLRRWSQRAGLREA